MYFWLMRISHTYILFILLLSSSYLCRGQQDSPNNKSLLWKISSPQLKKPSYLFGTIHLICPADLTWTEVMKKSFLETDKVCLEMDMDDPSLMMEIAVGMLDNSGKELKDYFSDSEYRQISVFIHDSLHMDVSMFQKLKPAALQTLYATRTVDCEAPIAYESMLTDEAKRQQKEVVGLETASDQLALFNNLPTDSVARELVEMTNSMQAEREKYKNLIRLYKKQDLPALYHYIENAEATGANLNDFLDVRNEKWIKRMVEMMDEGSVFFAVGAGHLWGEKGLISLLKKEGYKVVPVK